MTFDIRRVAVARAVAASAIAALLLAACSPSGEYPLLDHDHDGAMRSRAASHVAKPVSLLFIGNSFTFTNDLPAMLVNIASSDPAGDPGLEVQASTVAAARLAQHWADGGALKVLRSRHFDYAVLQEQTAWALHPQAIEDTYGAMFNWNVAVLAAGSKPLFFETWADPDGSDQYTGDARNLWFGLTRASAQRIIDAQTEKLSQTYKLPVAWVGQAFERAASTPRAPDLFGPDRHHPSRAGTYLAALTFYRHLTGRPGTGLSGGDRR